MVYTADENIAIAFSKSATGPFKNEMKTYFKTKEKQIDPFLFLKMESISYSLEKTE